MEQPEKDWLQQLGVAVSAQEKLASAQNKKAATLVKLATDRENQRGDIIDGTELKMTRGKKGEKARNTLDYFNHDQTKEVDIDDQKDGFRIADSLGKIEEWDPETGTQEQFQKHLKAARIVSGMADQMEKEMTDELDENGNPVPEEEIELDKKGQPVLDEKGNPKKVRELDNKGQPAVDDKGNPKYKLTGKTKQKRLFSDEEIATELYDPLRRRGLMPETSIPDKYSRTKEMLDGSFDAYKERLDKEDKKSKFSENFALGKTLFTSSLTIVGACLSIDSAASKTGDELKSSWKPSDNLTLIKTELGEIPKEGTDELSSGAERAAKAFEFLNQGVNFTTEVVIEGGEQISEALEKEEGEEDPEHERRKGIAPKLAGSIVASVSSALGGKLNDVGLGIAASSTYGALTKAGPLAKLLSGKKLEAGNVAAIVTALEKGAADTLTKFDPKAGTSTAEVNKAILAFKMTVDAGKIVTAMKGGKFDEVGGVFAKAATTAAGAAITVKFLDVFKSKDNKLHAEGAAGEVMEEEFKRGDEEDEEPKPVHPTGQHEPDKPNWVKHEGKWVCADCLALKGDPLLFAGIIDRKIAKLKRDQAILNWGATLGGMAFEVASNFIAPLAIGGCALKMAKNIKLAVDRWSDFFAFEERQRRMFNAASAFSAPVAQFIYNSEMQSAHYTVNAACEGLKMIGAILQCSAVGAHAGVGMSAGANIAQAVEAVLYEAKKRYDLEKAWITYKIALSRPENRRLGLIALKENSTLAKYAVAWGAVIKKDQLVSDFMAACDLNADSLKDPKANIHKVVSYLEARLPDDQLIVGRKISVGSVKWAPGTIELTVASWSGTKGLGEAKGGLQPEDTRDIEVAIGKLTAKFDPWKNAAEDKGGSTLDKKDHAECTELLEKLRSAFAQYTPMQTKEAGGKYNSEMGQVVESFEALVDERIEIVKAWKTK